MSLKKWGLSHSPSEKDKNRWLLKLKIDERELMSLVNSISGTVGRPFLLDKDECNFGFYIYEAREDEISSMKELLRTKCPESEPARADKPAGKKGSIPCWKEWREAWTAW